MASNVETRVRALTNYGTDIISSSDMTTLEEIAKDEIKSDVGVTSLDFTKPDPKSGLMWLLCIFSKIHIGEIGAEGYQIAEIETKDLNDQSKVWFDQYKKRRAMIEPETRIGHAKASRSGRGYGGSGGTAFGDGDE